MNVTDLSRVSYPASMHDDIPRARDLLRVGSFIVMRDLTGIGRLWKLTEKRTLNSGLERFVLDVCDGDIPRGFPRGGVVKLESRGARSYHYIEPRLSMFGSGSRAEMVFTVIPATTPAEALGIIGCAHAAHRLGLFAEAFIAAKNALDDATTALLAAQARAAGLSVRP